MENVADAVVIGGGIAGLSAARALLRAGLRRVRVLEREPVPCAHSSGRNAAIFRHLSPAAGDLELAVESRALLGELCGGEDAWLARTGMWLLAETRAPLEPLARLAVANQLDHGRASDAALDEAIPALHGGAARHGLWCPDDGVIDIHEVAQALVRAVTSLGGVLSFGAEVARIEVDGGRAAGVQLTSGERLAAGAVVIAAGAWAGALGAEAGASMALEPRRRHLAQLEVKPPLPSGAPVLWNIGDEIYLRPESGGVLASPCDEEAWRPELPAPTDGALELLSAKMARFAPRLAHASVRRAWACLRTFTPDRAPVIGPDPRVAGLFWLAGLGGHGMTGGLAAGEILAARATGRSHALAGTLDPGRL